MFSLRAGNINEPIFVLLGLTSIEDRIKSLRLGADDYLCKHNAGRYARDEAGAQDRNRAACAARRSTALIEIGAQRHVACSVDGDASTSLVSDRRSPLPYWSASRLA